MHGEICMHAYTVHYRCMEKQIQKPIFLKINVGFEPQFGQNQAFKIQWDYFYAW